MKPRSFYVNRTFRDDVHYPYGLRRSGEFTVRESDLLEKHGALCRALMTGEVEDPTTADNRLLDVIAGNLPAETELEKVWLKYNTKIQKKTIVPSMSISGARDTGVGYMQDAAELDGLYV